MQLREAREARGLSIKQLHEVSGVAATTILGLETRKHRPTAATINKLCAVPGVQSIEMEEYKFTGAKYPEFQEILSKASLKKGLTIRQACAAAQIDHSNVSGWVMGEHEPLRHLIERLAEVLDAPEIVDSIPSRRSQIKVTCPDCGTVRRYRASVLRSNSLNSPSIDADWEGGSANYRCSFCAKSATMKTRHQKIKRNVGKQYYIELGNQMYATLTPEAHARGVAKSADRRRGAKRSAEAVYQSAVGNMAPRLKGKFNVCRICSQLTFVRESDARRFGGPRETHATCLHTWQSQHPMPSFPQGYPKRPFRNTSSPEYLATSYEICVRHLLKGEDIGEWKYDGYGTGLVKEFGRGKSTILKRIKRFLLLLPTDGRGGKLLNRRAEALLTAVKSRGYQL